MLSQITYMSTQRVPTAVSTADMQDIVNEMQNTLYRLFVHPEDVEPISLVQGIPMYPLPSYIMPERIRSVTVMTPSTGSPPAPPDDSFSDWEEDEDSWDDSVGYLGEYQPCTQADGLIDCSYSTLQTEAGNLIFIYPAPPVASGTINGVSVTSGGSNYTTAPAVAITGGGGSGATATAVVVNGAVTAVYVTNPGSGYTGTPTVSFTGGGGTGAAATANVFNLYMMIIFEDGPNLLDNTVAAATVPRFFQDYHMLFVYGLAAELAGLRGDGVRQNFWSQKYDAMLAEALNNLGEATQAKVRW